MKVLITGFDPFGGESVNPAYEAVKMLPDMVAGAEVIKLEIPTVFTKSGEAVEKAMEEHNPDVVICVGQAGGRSSITIDAVKDTIFVFAPYCSLITVLDTLPFTGQQPETADTRLLNENASISRFSFIL